METCVAKYEIFNQDGQWVGQTDNLQWALGFIEKHGGEIYSTSGAGAGGGIVARRYVKKEG